MGDTVCLATLLGRDYSTPFIRLFLTFVCSASLSKILHGNRVHWASVVVPAAATAIILAFLWSSILLPKVFSPFRGLPTIPGGSFLNGHFYQMMAQPAGLLERRWINTIPHNGIIRYHTILNQERLLLTTEETIKEAIGRKSYDWEKASPMRIGLGRLLGNGIVLSTGHDHKIQRKALRPAFDCPSMRQMFKVIWHKANELSESVEQEILRQRQDSNAEYGIISWAYLSNRTALDIIGLTGFNLDFNSINDPNSSLSVAYNSVLATGAASWSMQLVEALIDIIPMQIIQLFPSSFNASVDRAANVARDIGKACVASLSSRTENANSSIPKTILSTGFDKKTLSLGNLEDQAMTILAAGHETVSSSVNWSLLILCRHPSIQRRLQLEIRQAFGSQWPASEDGTMELIDSLPYLQAFCNEVLRLFPPIPNIRRTSVRDTSIMGIHIPKGTDIMISAAAYNTSHDIWGEDAEEFKPERWLATVGDKNDNVGTSQKRLTSLTFAYGPRSCLGQTLARAEIACLLAVIVAKFDYALPGPKTNLEYTRGFLWRVPGELPLLTKAAPSLSTAAPLLTDATPFLAKAASAA